MESLSWLFFKGGMYTDKFTKSLLPNLRFSFNFYIPLLWARESISKHQHLLKQITSPSSLLPEQPDLCWLQPTPSRPDLHRTARLHKGTSGLKTSSCTKIVSGLCRERVVTQHRTPTLEQRRTIHRKQAGSCSCPILPICSPLLILPMHVSFLQCTRTLSQSQWVYQNTLLQESEDNSLAAQHCRTNTQPQPRGGLDPERCSTWEGSTPWPSLPSGHFASSLLPSRPAACSAGCTRVAAHTRARAQPHACSLPLVFALSAPPGPCLLLHGQQTTVFCSSVLLLLRPPFQLHQTKQRLSGPSQVVIHPSDATASSAFTASSILTAAAIATKQLIFVLWSCTSSKAFAFLGCESSTVQQLRTLQHVLIRHETPSAPRHRLPAAGSILPHHCFPAPAASSDLFTSTFTQRLYCVPAVWHVVRLDCLKKCRRCYRLGVWHGLQ